MKRKNLWKQETPICHKKLILYYYQNNSNLLMDINLFPAQINQICIVIVIWIPLKVTIKTCFRHCFHQNTQWNMYTHVIHYISTAVGWRDEIYGHCKVFSSEFSILMVISKKANVGAHALAFQFRFGMFFWSKCPDGPYCVVF